MSEISITMKIVTHDCGMVYQIPSWIYQFTCPACAKRKIAEANSETERLMRSNNALRGAMTRLRKRR